MSKYESSLIEVAVKKHLEDCFDRTPRLICGVSGGVDSMVLLHVLRRLGIDLLVVHINYQTRGEDSERDQDLVEKMCRLYQAECVSVRLDPEASEGNFQAWAREQRYEVFRGLMREESASGIATAHHQTDQVETILQRIFRGAGMEHWAGMRTFEQGLFRPLLTWTKQEIRSYAMQEGLLFREDSSNERPEYGRNFIRLGLEPELNRFFPGWQKNLLALRERADEIEAMQMCILASVLDADKESVNRPLLLQLPENLWPPVLSRWVQSRTSAKRSKGTMRQFLHIDSLQTGQAIAGGMDAGGTVVWVVRDRDRFTLSKSWDGEKGVGPKSEALVAGDVKAGGFKVDDFKATDVGATDAMTTDVGATDAMTTDGRPSNSELVNRNPEAEACTIFLEMLRDGEVPECAARSGVLISLKNWHTGLGFRNEQLHLDAAKIGFPLTLRRWRDGDRIQPLGMHGTRLVSDVLTDRKVSSAEKKQAQVLLSFDGTVCAVIFPHPLSQGSVGAIAENCKCTGTTTSIVTLSIR